MSDNSPGFNDILAAALAKDRYVPTNADRIRAMTDDELAEFLTSVHFVDVLWCSRWLKCPPVNEVDP